MTSSTNFQSEPILPELEALESFLASHPDDLKTLMDVPFGKLLERIASFGFDSDILRQELISAGLFSEAVWVESVGLHSIDDFWGMTPLQYCEEFPEIGASLVIGTIKSIHVSEEQLALLSNAGGKTNLTTAQKWEIAGGSILVGYVLPKTYRTWRTSTNFTKEQVKDYANQELPWINDEGIEMRYNFNYSEIAGGTRYVAVETKTLFGRIYVEWSNTLPGTFVNKVIKPLVNKLVGNRTQQRIDSELTESVHSFSTSIRNDSQVSEAIESNIRESKERPEHEVQRIDSYSSNHNAQLNELIESAQSPDLRSSVNHFVEQQIVSSFNNSLINVEEADNRVERFEKKELSAILTNEEKKIEQQFIGGEAQLELEAQQAVNKELKSVAKDVEESVEESIEESVKTEEELITNSLDR